MNQNVCFPYAKNPEFGLILLIRKQNDLENLFIERFLSQAPENFDKKAFTLSKLTKFERVSFFFH